MSMHQAQAMSDRQLHLNCAYVIKHCDPDAHYFSLSVLLVLPFDFLFTFLHPSPVSCLLFPSIFFFSEHGTQTFFLKQGDVFGERKEVLAPSPYRVFYPGKQVVYYDATTYQNEGAAAESTIASTGDLRAPSVNDLTDESELQVRDMGGVHAYWLRFKILSNTLFSARDTEGSPIPNLHM